MLVWFAVLAQVVELVDTRDLKSLEGNFVPVQVRLWAPLFDTINSRLMFKEEFMLSAIEQAKISSQMGEVPVGCVITLEDKIIGIGRNRCISTKSPVRHAEIEAIEMACNELQNYRLINTSIFITLEPCHMCCMAIVNARISNLFFGALEPKTGSIVSVDTFLDRSFLNHKVSYSGPHLEEECSLLMKNFFQSRR